MLICMTIYAQGLSSEIETARRHYFDGSFKKAITALESLDDDELISAQWIDKHLLLVRSALVLEEYEIADRYLKTLLEKYPTLKQKEDALPSLNQFKDQYKMRIISSVALDIGTSIPRLVLLRDHSFASRFTRANTYQSLPGLSLGTSVSWRFNERLSLSGSLIYNGYELIFEEAQMDLQRIKVTEQYHEISFPLAVGIHQKLGSSEISLSAGLRPVFLLSSDAELLFTADEVRQFGQPTPFTFSDTQPVNDYRESSNLDFQAGIRLKKYFERQFVSLGITYVYGPKNRTNVDERYVNESLFRTFSYVPDDIARDIIQITVGVGISNFRVEKR